MPHPVSPPRQQSIMISKTSDAAAPAQADVSALLGSTLVNLYPGGCVAGVCLTLACAAITWIVCSKVLWDKTLPESLSSGSMHRTQHANPGF